MQTGELWPEVFSNSSFCLDPHQQECVMGVRILFAKNHITLASSSHGRSSIWESCL